ncbi:MAG: PfkB family carbohydrate kinase [Desulfobacterales bacterium]
MIVLFGEILLDCFPDYRRIGGAPFNVAFHLMHLGVPIRFLSRIGDDPEGRGIIEFLHHSGFPTEDLQIDPGKPTGKVLVHDADGASGPRFEILSEAAYDHVAPSPRIIDALRGEARLLYFGTLIQRTENGRETLERLLAARSPATRCIVDINLRPDCFSRATVLRSLEVADILKLNADELEEIVSMCGQEGLSVDDVPSLMETFRIESVALTLGDKGSRIYASGREEMLRPPPIEGFRNSVGAGDGFAAMLAMGHLKGWPPRRILERATAFASRICTLEGAVPESGRFYNDATEGGADGLLV